MRLLPRERARGGVFPCAHVQAGCLLEAAAGTSERGRAQRERTVSLAQWAYIGHERLQAAWRGARTPQARVLRLLPRETAPWRFFLRTRASWLLIGGRGWQNRARPCTEGEGRLTGAVGFHRTWANCNQRDAARARRKRACCASSRERAHSCAFACAHTRMPAARCRPRLACRSTAVHRGIGPPPWHIGLLKNTGQLQPARRSARASQARVLRLLPRESARWRVCVCAHTNAGCSSEAAAGTSEHSRAPRDRAFSVA